jgi:hypothetical protein
VTAFSLFLQSQDIAKYLGDVDDVDDVPLIIVATFDEGVLYGTAKL